MENINYDILLERWSKLVDNLIRNKNNENTDVLTLKPVIYDTYHFCRKELENINSISRDKLLLYKTIVQAGTCIMKDLPKGMTLAESLTCLDCIEGLLYVIENGFNAGYGKYPLPLGFTGHTPAGGADPEADMTSYESFEKSFEDNVMLLREEYDYD